MSARASASRWFEKILEDARNRLLPRKKFSIGELLERLARLGDVVFPRIVYAANRIAEVLNRLQVTLIESMILASLWFGAISLLILLVVLLVR